MNPLEFKNHLVKQVIKPAFKRAGFHVSGIHFQKEEEGFVKVFNVQSSQFSSSETALFYFNLGLFFPLAYSTWRRAPDGTAIPLPKTVKETDCQVRFRSNELPNGLGCYPIQLGADQQALALEVSKEIDDVILPFFASIRTLNDCLAKPSDLPRYVQSTSVAVGLTHASFGRTQEAARILRAFLSTQHFPSPWRERLEEEARSRGVDL